MNARFYQTAAGGDPVREYLRTCSDEQRKEVGDDIRLIQTFGLSAAGLVIKAVSGYPKLWEIKSKHMRTFYGVKGSTCWIVHCFDKNSTRTPEKEIDLAYRRLREILAQK